MWRRSSRGPAARVPLSDALRTPADGDRRAAGAPALAALVVGAGALAFALLPGGRPVPALPPDALVPVVAAPTPAEAEVKATPEAPPSPPPPPPRKPPRTEKPKTAVKTQPARRRAPAPARPSAALPAPQPDPPPGPAPAPPPRSAAPSKPRPSGPASEFGL